MKYCIKETYTDNYLIENYGFKKKKWHDTYNLIIEDEDGYGLQVWWEDRSLMIILGDHADYGIAPIPEILIQLLKDKIIEEKEDN